MGKHYKLKTLIFAIAVASINNLVFAQTAAPYVEPGVIGNAKSWETPEYKGDWGLQRIEANEAYAKGFDGAGIKVGELDSGFDQNHLKFKNSRLHSVLTKGEYLNGRPFSVEGFQNNNNDSHGTHVAGTIAASRNGGKMHGVAFRAELYVANTNHNDDFLFGPKPDYNYFSAAYDALAAKGVRIINNSWGSQPDDVNYETLDELRHAYSQHFGKLTWLDAAKKISNPANQGIINVFSAGNTGYKNASLRAIYPYFHPELEGHWLAVTGIDEDGEQMHNGCGISKYWCMTAPGIRILSTIGTSARNNQPFESWNGTSMAAPHATGALALIMQRFPYMTNEQALNVLLTTAVTLTQKMTKVPDENIGWGVINLKNAMNGPGQLLGSFNAQLPGGIVDAWSNDISDAALIQRKKEDTTEHANWLKLVKSKWPRGLPANASLGDQVRHAEGVARERAFQTRLYVGSLVKSGLGTLVLKGNNTYRGTTRIDQGRLVVDGSVTGGVVVNDSGLLSGRGTVGSLIANSGGTVAPGDVVQTLHVKGDVTFNAGSRYHVAVGRNADGALVSGKIEAKGRARLNGGEVAIQEENKLGMISATKAMSLLGTYNILNAKLGITGRFDVAAPQYLFVGTNLNYSARDVTLSFTRNQVSFASFATTPDEIKVGTAINSLGDSNPVYEALMRYTAAPQARQAFHTVAVAPKAVSSLGQSVTLASQQVEQLLLTRINTPRVAQAFSLDNAILLASADGVTASDVNAWQPPVNTSPEHSVWLQPVLSWGKSTPDAGIAARDRSTSGFLLGADSDVGRGVWLGLAAGLDNSDVNAVDRSLAATVKNYHFMLYANKQFESIKWRAGAIYSQGSINATRSAAMPNLLEVIKSNYEARNYTLFNELGYVFELQRFSFEPFVRLSYVHNEHEQIKETGGNLALVMGAESTNSGVATLGAHFTLPIITGHQSLSLIGGASWQYLSQPRNRKIDARFVSGGQSFQIEGINEDKYSAQFEGKVNWAFGKTWNADIGYQLDTSKQNKTNSLSGNLVFRW